VSRAVPRARGTVALSPRRAALSSWRPAVRRAGSRATVRHRPAVSAARERRFARRGSWS